MVDTVAIGSTDYPVYGSLSRAEAYFAAAVHADSWEALADLDKNQLLVTATRTLDRQRWKGDKTVADQDLAFPRVNMGITPEPLLDVNDIPVDMVNASFELALSIADGSDVQNVSNTSEKIKSYTAGSVSITNFFSSANVVPTRFPQIVQELVRPYLAGSGSTGFTGVATGTDGETSFPADLGLALGGF